MEASTHGSTLQVMPIPDEDLIYMRIHKVNIDFKLSNTEIRPVAFDTKGEGGLSVNWSEHSTAESTQAGTGASEKYGVISMNVGKVRNIPHIPLIVSHVPLEDNYSHAEVFGIPPRKPSDMGARVKMMDLLKWEIHCSE